MFAKDLKQESRGRKGYHLPTHMTHQTVYSAIPERNYYTYFTDGNKAYYN
jgi:hypothetical protein